MQATTEQIKEICRILHDWGREATPSEVKTWLNNTSKRYSVYLGTFVGEYEIAESVIDGNKTMTMCLHLKFGDAL